MWSNLIQSLKLEYENTVQQNSETDAVMECVCGVQSSKTALPRGKQPRPQLLHLHPSRNSMSKDDESGNLPMTLTKEPRSLQYPP
jgi:hypothetical protein